MVYNMCDKNISFSENCQSAIKKNVIIRMNSIFLLNDCYAHLLV